MPVSNTFDNPVTAEGRAWRAALKSISKVDGWSAVWWGRREECLEEVELILGILPALSFKNQFLGLLAFRQGPRSTRQPLIRSPNIGWKNYHTFESFLVLPLDQALRNYRSSNLHPPQNTSCSAVRSLGYDWPPGLSTWSGSLTSPYRV